MTDILKVDWLTQSWLTHKWLTYSKLTDWHKVDWLTHKWLTYSKLTDWHKVDWLTQSWLTYSKLTDWHKVDWLTHKWLTYSLRNSKRWAITNWRTSLRTFVVFFEALYVFCCDFTEKKPPIFGPVSVLWNHIIILFNFAWGARRSSYLEYFC